AVCKDCPEGFYCDATTQNDTICSHGVQNPLECPSGHFCPNGTKFALEFPCPAGTFNNVTQLKAEAECLPCTGGQYCETTGLTNPTGPCLEGYYCTLGAAIQNPLDNVTGSVCPPGSYCEGGSPSPTPCPAGTYTPSE
ncbi:unnamed protein product, partial [Owenia fusiformis]